MLSGISARVAKNDVPNFPRILNNILSNFAAVRIPWTDNVAFDGNWKQLPKKKKKNAGFVFVSV